MIIRGLEKNEKLTKIIIIITKVFQKEIDLSFIDKYNSSLDKF